MNNWQYAFILHTKKYSETSLLVDLFVEKSGKVRVLAKGAKRSKSSMLGALQLFTPLLVQYTGRGELKTLRQVESLSLALPLSSVFLYSAFYLNELLHRVLMPEADTAVLFHCYLSSLKQLANQKPAEPILRHFELTLLDNLGSAIDFFHCGVSGDAIDENEYYEYQYEKGFIVSSQKNLTAFRGLDVLAIGRRQFENRLTLKMAKRLTRIALNPYVGSKPFKSRELFLKL